MQIRLLAKWKDGAATCVVMASNGYPESYKSGFEIKIADEVQDSVYVAGARLDGEKLLTAGGRVLGVTAVRDTLEDAITMAYKKTEGVDFLGAYMRKDICKRALLAKKG